MKRLLILMGLLLVLVGCSSLTNKLVSEPPNLKLKTATGTYDTVLGTYCWEISTGKSECVDKVGPVDLVKDEKVIEVEKGETVQFVLDESLRPEVAYLTRIIDAKEKDVFLSEEYTFVTPDTVGEYIYGFTGKWNLDDKNVSNGDAQYVFKLKVNE
ncbi:MAG: hypothetical protein KBT36_04505 [Kurthia sp.]|nr:hypothetical protein [Candidatus Kurthia equi]